MNLSDAKLGDVYRIYLDSNRNMSSSMPTATTIVATVIAVKKPGNDDKVILGWTADQVVPTNAVPRSLTSASYDYIHNEFIYEYGRSVSRVMLVATKISNDGTGSFSKNGLDGFPCKKCQTFYPQSLPNQNDGTLICWSCRNTH